MNVGDAGTLMRLKAGTKTAEHITALPDDAHCNLLYETGGVIVAFGGTDAFDIPDQGSAASISAHNGVTWLQIPVSQQ